MPLTYLEETRAELARQQKTNAEQAELLNLYRRHPTLVPCEANDEAFRRAVGNDPLTVEVCEVLLSSNERFAQTLAWRTTQEAEKAEAIQIKQFNDDQKQRSPQDLKTELAQRATNYRESVTPVPPASLTRKTFKDASPEQARKWVRLYGSAALDAHWLAQENR